MRYRLQVSREHYFEKDYDTKDRWMSYWYQINEVLETKGKKVLEVGIGNRTVTNYLRERGLEVTTVDIDPDLNPDYVCSVTELTKLFRPNSFDVVLCAEVLEHLPFRYFGKALNELHTVTKRFVVLSLPYAGPSFRFCLKMPFIGERNITVKLPLHRKHRFDGQHYWEIGKKGYPLTKIKQYMTKRFRIVKSYVPPENMYHIFFVLSKA